MKGVVIATVLFALVACSMSDERRTAVTAAAKTCGAEHGTTSHFFFDCLRSKGVDPSKDCGDSGNRVACAAVGSGR